MWLPVRFGVASDLPHIRSVGAHNKYISLIVITQRIEGDPLTIGGEGRSRVIASVRKLDSRLRIDVDQEDVLIPLQSGINQQGFAIRGPIQAAADSWQTARQLLDVRAVIVHDE